MAMLKKITAVGMTIVLAGCAADAGQKEQAAAVLGAVVGGILGGAISGDRNRAAGVVAGALAGGLAGSQIGRYFDEQDRRRIAEGAQRALDQGVAQRYVSPKTGASVVMTPGTSSYEPGRSIRTLSSVEAVPGLRASSRVAYAAGHNLPVLASPSATAEVTGRFARGEQLEIIGIVPDSPYCLVARKGVGIGYVLERDLVGSLADVPPLPDVRLAGGSNLTSSPASAKPVAKPSAKQAKRPVAKPPVPKPEATETASAGRLQEAVPAEAKTTPVAYGSPATQEVKAVTVARECKPMTYVFSLPNGQRSNEARKWCNDPPRGWQTVAT